MCTDFVCRHTKRHFYRLLLNPRTPSNVVIRMLRGKGENCTFSKKFNKNIEKRWLCQKKSGHDGGHSDPFFRLWSIFQLIFNIDLILIIRSFRANVFTHPRTPIQCWWNLLILPQGTRHFREDAIVHLTATRHAWRARAYPMMKGSIRCHENVISRFYKNSYTAKI